MIRINLFVHGQSLSIKTNIIIIPWHRSPPEIAARWRYSLSSNNLTAHYNSQFQLSFWFLPGSPKMPLNVSELGLNLIQFISNLYVDGPNKCLTGGPVGHCPFGRLSLIFLNGPNYAIWTKEPKHF